MTISRLYISDLDGTLLNKKGVLSSFSTDGIKKLIERNISFSVATARNLFSIQQLLKELPLNTPVISRNGAYISCFTTSRHFIVNSIPTQNCQNIIDWMERENIAFFCDFLQRGIEYVSLPSKENPGSQWFIRDMRQMNQALMSFKQVSLPSVQMISFTVIDEYSIVKEIETNMLKLFNEIDTHIFENPYQEGWYWLTINHPLANKSRACFKLAEILEIEPSKITFFGDNYNDLHAFEQAAHRVAVANAVEPIKQLAHQIIGNHDDDSVVRFILEHTGLTD